MIFYMFRFEHPEILYLLALLPIPAVLHWLGWSAVQRRMRAFGQERQIGRLLQGGTGHKTGWRTALWTIAFLFLVIAWANPQWGTRREAIKSKGIEVFIALDLSQSMLAQDVAPNRIERARRFAADLALRLRGNKTGLIVFAGSAYLQVPLTSDYAAIALFANSASPETIPDQGTAIAEVIELAGQYFSQKSKGGKALIIISDGEDHEASAAEALRRIRKQGINVFTLGVGTASGSFIPMQMSGQEDVKRDERGTPIRSRLNETMLRDLAQEGGGSYYSLSANLENTARALLSQIGRIEKREMEQRVFSEYESYFQPFLFLSMLFWLLEWLIVCFGGIRRQREVV
jgi:Ca-activated chloride channel family protein